MDTLVRWMPFAALTGVVLLAWGNARRIGRRLGYSPVTVFNSGEPIERARIYLAIACIVYLAATSVDPGLAAWAPGFLAPRWLCAVGLVLLAAALLLVLASFGTLGESWRIGVDEEHATELVTGGVYGVVRHPIYAGFLWCFLGLLALHPNLLFVLYAVGAFLLCRLQARREERFLIQRHGEAYEAYMRSTGMFFPAPWRH